MSPSPLNAIKPWHYVVSLGLILLVVYLLMRDPPNPPPTSCIEAPKVDDQTAQKSVNDHALSLEKLATSANLKRDFEVESKATYAALSEKNTALFLLLRAIECYIKLADSPEKRKVVEQIAPELARTAHDLWRTQLGLRGGDQKTLSVREKDELNKSRYAKELLASLRSFGIE